MSDEPFSPAYRMLNMRVDELTERLTVVISERFDRLDKNISVLLYEQAQSFELLQQLEMRVAGLERRLSMITIAHEETRTELRTVTQRLRDLEERMAAAERAMADSHRK